jgi:hypothetical protein
MSWLGAVLGALKVAGKETGKAMGQGVLNNIRGGGQQPQDDRPKEYPIEPRPGMGMMPAPTAAPSMSTDLMAPYRESSGSGGLSPMNYNTGGAPSSSPTITGMAPSTAPPPPLMSASPGAPQLDPGASPGTVQPQKPGVGRRMLGALENVMRPRQSY